MSRSRAPAAGSESVRSRTTGVRLSQRERALLERLAQLLQPGAPPGITELVRECSLTLATLLVEPLKPPAIHFDRERQLRRAIRGAITLRASLGVASDGGS